MAASDKHERVSEACTQIKCDQRWALQSRKLNDHRVDTRVQFLVCGAQKSGTTALAAYLRQHPGLFVPETKELHYFDNEALHWPAGEPDELHQHFTEAREGQLWGEATPISMYWDSAPERIWQYNPEMRMIAVLRNPIERAYSHWAMEHARGDDPLPFEQALNLESERCREALPLQHRVFSYVDRGFYSQQLRRLWRFFGKEAVLVLRHEDLRANPQRSLETIWRHLDVPDGPTVEPLERNSRNNDIPMPEQARRRLRRLFWHEIGQLEALLDWDCSAWLRE